MMKKIILKSRERETCQFMKVEEQEGKGRESLWEKLHGLVRRPLVKGSTVYYVTDA